MTALEQPFKKRYKYSREAQQRQGRQKMIVIDIKYFVWYFIFSWLFDKNCLKYNAFK